MALSTTSKRKTINKAVIEQGDSSAKVFACRHPGCLKWFSKRYNLKAHSRLHTGNTPFCCPRDECEREFKWRSSLSSHAAWHLRKDAGEHVREYSPKRRAKQMASLRQSIEAQTSKCDQTASNRSQDSGDTASFPDESDVSTSVMSEETLLASVGSAENSNAKSEETMAVTGQGDEGLALPKDELHWSGGKDHHGTKMEISVADELFQSHYLPAKCADERIQTCGLQGLDALHARQYPTSLVQSGFAAACETFNIIDDSDGSDELDCFNDDVTVKGSNCSIAASSLSGRENYAEAAGYEVDTCIEAFSNSNYYGLYQGGEVVEESIALF